MENYKVKVSNEAESREVQELFFSLGYKWFSGGTKIQHTEKSYSPSFGYLVAWTSGCFVNVIQCGCGDETANEITLPELRQLAGKESLNNTYAEIEQVRKAIKVESGADSNHTADAASYALFGFKQPDPLPFIDDNPLYEHTGSQCNENQSGYTNPQQDANNATNANAWQIQVGGDHYKKLKIQPMEYALANKLDYAQANVVKYVTRHADKNGKEDLLKAIHNIQLMIEHYYAD